MTVLTSETAWGWYDYYVYVQLKPGIDYRQLEAKMPAFTDKYINSDEWRKKNNVRDELHLIPLNDIHLYSNYNQEASKRKWAGCIIPFFDRHIYHLHCMDQLYKSCYGKVCRTCKRGRRTQVLGRCAQ